MPLTIATWNINSVRLRLALVERLLREETPDVLCLQETKSPDEHFPAQALADAGWSHQVFRGEKGYNGVAILSRVPLEPLEHHDYCGRGDCRHVAARLGNGLAIHNFYVPAGGDVPDRTANDKFGHKLDFVAEMAAVAADRQGAAIWVGDLNIAPLETDVWSHKKLLKVVSHTPVEVDALNAVQAAGRFIDVPRRFIPPEEPLYSWWSYRAKDWSAADKGRRLDHVWASPDLESALSGAHILRDVRGWEKGSDHAPVVAAFKLD